MTTTKQIILIVCNIIDAAADINGSPIPMEVKLLTWLIRNYEPILMFLHTWIKCIKHQKE